MNPTPDHYRRTFVTKRLGFRSCRSRTPMHPEEGLTKEMFERALQRIMVKWLRKSRIPRIAQLGRLVDKAVRADLLNDPSLNGLRTAVELAEGMRAKGRAALKWLRALPRDVPADPDDQAEQTAEASAEMGWCDRLAPSPSVVLRQPPEVVVRGELRRLTPRRYALIKVLVDAWPRRLTTPELEEKTGQAYPGRTLRQMKLKKPWDQVIDCPGQDNKDGGYTLRPRANPRASQIPR